MEKPIRFSDLEDCESCPLHGDGDLCSSFSSMPHMSEPPCVTSNDDLISDYIDGYYDYQDELSREQEKKEQKQKELQKRKEKARQTRWYVSNETIAIKRQRKFIALLESRIRFAENVGDAFSLVHSMLERKDVKFQENDNMKALRRALEDAQAKLIELEATKKQKLKEYRISK